MLILAGPVVLLTIWHVYLEFRDDLAAYLGRLVGFEPPRWLPILLVISAVVGPFTPIWVGLMRPDLADACLSFLVGALLADAFFTHLIPTWVTGEESPAFWTLWLQAILASGIVIWMGTVQWPIILGVSYFLGLWPGLFFLRWLELRAVR